MATRTRLTRAQKNAIADALNVSESFVRWHPYYLDLISGVNALVPGNSGLELDVEEAIATTRLDLKWEIDGPALLENIAAMTPDERRTLVLAIAKAWTNCRNERFDIILDECPV